MQMKTSPFCIAANENKLFIGQNFIVNIGFLHELAGMNLKHTVGSTKTLYIHTWTNDSKHTYLQFSLRLHLNEVHLWLN